MCNRHVECCECSSYLCNRDRCTECEARLSASAPGSIPVPSDAEPESPRVLQEDDNDDSSSDISSILSRSTVDYCISQSELQESISTSLLSSRPSSPAACASDIEQGELFNEK